MQGHSVDIMSLKKTNLLSKIKEERRERTKSSASSTTIKKTLEKKREEETKEEENKEEEEESLNNLSIYTFSGKLSEEVSNSDNSERTYNRRTTDSGNNVVSMSGVSEDSSRHKRSTNLLKLAKEAKTFSNEKSLHYEPPNFSSFSLDKQASKKSSFK